MSGENYVNTASTATTSAPIGPSDTTVTVASYTGWPTAPYWAELEKGTASAEIVRVTNVAGSVLTITRGQGGTAATSHGAGVNVEHIVPASHFNEGETHNAATNAHGVTGVVVGTQGAQTVQDKNFRGAFRSDYADALPAGVTASFESNANSAAARDGFVHKNTAGDAARFAFRAQQSGTDRFTVSNTGNVVVNPSSGTAIAATGPATVSGTLDVGGALTVSSGGASVTGGLTVPSGGVTVTGTSSVNGNTSVTGTLTASSTVTGGSFTTAGTVHAGGNIDTDSNLTVDGTSTLTGTVTAGGAVNATGAVSGASGAFTGAVTAHGGNRVVAAVPTPSSVGSPVGNQAAWSNTQKDWYRYDSTAVAWLPARQIGGRLVTTAGNIHTGITTTETNITKLDLLGGVVRAGTWYVFNVKLRLTMTKNLDSFTVRVREGTALTGTILAEWQVIAQVDGFTHDWNLHQPWRCPTDDGGADFHVSIVRAAGTGSVDVSGERRTAFWIDDRGADSGIWQEVA